MNSIDEDPALLELRNKERDHQRVMTQLRFYHKVIPTVRKTTKVTGEKGSGGGG